MLGELPSNVPLPGEIFAEKYRIERVLGRGGMGVVFAATHIHLHQRFALKLLLPAAALEPETVERFMREGRAVVKIKSEHVARVIDVGGLLEGTPYLVMEHLEGMDFAELLDGERQLPTALAVDYVLQACEAVAEAHALGIVHRDLKPSNLFLATQADGREIVKVLDFGISKMLEPGLDMTRTAAMLGSPLYMSPEQLKSPRDVDSRADVWSIGVILYQLIAGTPPFVADSLPELCALVLSKPTRWLHREVPDVPTTLSRVVATCLRSNVAERYANLADLADALAPFGTAAARVSADRIVGLLGLSTTSATAPDPHRTRRWLAPALAALAIAGVSTAIAFRGARGPHAPDNVPAAAVPVEPPPATVTAPPPVVPPPPAAPPVASAEPPPAKVRPPALNARRPPPPASAAVVSAPAVADVPAPVATHAPVAAGVATSAKD